MPDAPDVHPDQGYASVNGLQMYYEVHGQGPPLLLLHGAYMTVEGMGALLEGLARTHRVVAPELQGHGRTADVDRPITYEQMADDAAALLQELGVSRADVVGFSMGGGVALQLAMRHPARVERLVVASAGFSSDGMHTEAMEMFPSITPEMFAGTPMEAAYLQFAPNPGDFPTLVAKLTQLDATPFRWSRDDVQRISAPTLVVVGDSDLVRLEHAVELFGMLGGGVMGDLAGLPASQLAVLPGTTHFMPPGSGLMDRASWLVPMIAAFLGAPIPTTGESASSG